MPKSDAFIKDVGQEKSGYFRRDYPATTIMMKVVGILVKFIVDTSELERESTTHRNLASGFPRC